MTELFVPDYLFRLFAVIVLFYFSVHIIGLGCIEAIKISAVGIWSKKILRVRRSYSYTLGFTIGLLLKWTH